MTNTHTANEPNRAGCEQVGKGTISSGAHLMQFTIHHNWHISVIPTTVKDVN